MNFIDEALIKTYQSSMIEQLEDHFVPAIGHSVNGGQLTGHVAS